MNICFILRVDSSLSFLSMFSHTSPFLTLALFTQPPPGVDDDFARGSRRGRTTWCNNEVRVLIINYFQCFSNLIMNLLPHKTSSLTKMGMAVLELLNKNYFQGVNIREVLCNFKMYFIFK